MKSAVIGAGFLALVSACSSETTGTGAGSSSGEPGVCAQRKGSYILKLTERAGNCGPGTETVVNIDAQPTSIDAPCVGDISYSADNCEVTYSSTCPNDGVIKGGELAITGKSKWSPDAKTGTAVEQWVLRNPDKTTLCQGTYDVAGSRQ